MSGKTLCRLCGRNTKEYVNMFSDEGLKRKLGIKTATCLQIPVSVCDVLPTIICHRCCDRLDDSYDLFERASKVQVFLESIYHPISELQIKEDPDSPNPEKLDELSQQKLSKKDGKRKKDMPSKPRICEALQGYPWTCVLCNSGVLDSLQDLSQHYTNSHNRPPIFKCIHCGRQYDRYRSFSKHCMLHQSPKKFECNICGKTFNQKSILNAHALVHTDNRPYPCEICGKSFKSTYALAVHSKLHLPVEKRSKFSCELCGRIFKTKNALECHGKMHNEERDFLCDICGKSFVSKGSLITHLGIHSEEKSYACNICNRGFRTERLLSKHSVSHTLMKPYQCEICYKSFREKGTLTAHTRIHTGVTPYKCDICEKSFRYLAILVVHKRQHTGEKPYTCSNCNRNFTNSSNYKKHLKRMHNSLTNTEDSKEKESETVIAEHELTDMEHIQSEVVVT
ncbi:zinc finger protein OZF [Fopius arisanus]|uniref:Zinc finger protein OZF n=1 Tax=Fopius arisanus TaxID=64838 RepID=A0A9R1SVY0_9HYME|nr:PREDICTED: zinc finger protein OZF-like [Fopius arisanus]